MSILVLSHPIRRFTYPWNFRLKIIHSTLRTTCTPWYMTGLDFSIDLHTKNYTLHAAHPPSPSNCIIHTKHYTLQTKLHPETLQYTPHTTWYKIYSPLKLYTTNHTLFTTHTTLPLYIPLHTTHYTLNFSLEVLAGGNSTVGSLQSTPKSQRDTDINN